MYSYILLNEGFYRWLETEYLPIGSQILFLKLIHLFNQSAWSEWLTVDNQRMMTLVQTKREQTLIEWRDKLLEKQLITYVKGRKGQPNRYKLDDKLAFINGAKRAVNSVVKNDTVVNTVVNPVGKDGDTVVNSVVNPVVNSVVNPVVNSVVNRAVNTADINRQDKKRQDKNTKKEKNEKEKVFSDKSFDELIDDYTRNKQLRFELKEHLRTRKAKKSALTTHAIELSLRKLDSLASNDEEKIEIVQNAIERGYPGFFPLPDVKKTGVGNQKKRENLIKYTDYDSMDPNDWV